MLWIYFRFMVTSLQGCECVKVCDVEGLKVQMCGQDACEGVEVRVKA